MILFFDTETTGFPLKQFPASHVDQPYLVQLAALLTEDDGRERASMNCIIEPTGYQIPDKVAAIHGISTDLARRCGVPLSTALRLFICLSRRADRLVAHNIQFDCAIIETAMSRVPAIPHEPIYDTYCTMKAATAICKIPSANPHFSAYKWPKLSECYKIFFGEDLVGAHDALVDVRACARVYFHLTSPDRNVA